MRIRTTAVAAAAVLSLTSCGGEPAPLTPADEEVVAARDEAVASMTAGLQALAAELGAEEPLGTRADTLCSAGTDNWKIHDTYRSTCRTSLTTAFPVDVDPAELFPDVAALEAFEGRLRDSGWGGAEWWVAGNTTAFDASSLGLSGGALAEVEGVRLYDGEGAEIGLGFQRADEPVPAPADPLYPTSDEDDGTLGTDWQDAWTGQTDWLLVGSGDAEILRQPW